MGEQQRWAVICYNSCESDEDCAGITTGAKFSSGRSSDLALFQFSGSGHCWRTNRDSRSNYADNFLDERKGKTSPLD